MTKLPVLSGLGIIKILNKFGYSEVRKRGSYIRLECPMKAPVESLLESERPRSR